MIDEFNDPFEELHNPSNDPDTYTMEKQEIFNTKVYLRKLFKVKDKINSLNFPTIPKNIIKTPKSQTKSHSLILKKFPSLNKLNNMIIKRNLKKTSFMTRKNRCFINIKTKTTNFGFNKTKQESEIKLSKNYLNDKKRKIKNPIYFNCAKNDDKKIRSIYIPKNKTMKISFKILKSNI